MFKYAVIGALGALGFSGTAAGSGCVTSGCTKEELQNAYKATELGGGECHGVAGSHTDRSGNCVTADCDAATELQTAYDDACAASDSGDSNSNSLCTGSGGLCTQADLDAAGFTEGSIHAKMSGTPDNRVKKWYMVTQAKASVAPTGFSASEKPALNSWGIKLKYCGNTGTNKDPCEMNYFEPGANAHVDVEFYKGGCASQPEELDECPMIYSLDTAVEKEAEAGEGAASDSGD